MFSVVFKMQSYDKKISSARIFYPEISVVSNNVFPVK